MDDKNKKIKVVDVVQDGGEEVLNLKTKVFIEPKIAVKPEIVEKPEAIAKTEPVLASLSPKIVFEKSAAKETKVKEIKTAKFGKSRGIRRFAIYFLMVVVIGGAVYGAVAFLPRVDIKIIVKKSDWQFSNSISASKNASNIDLSVKLIPAEVFFEKKNITLFYPASGVKQIEKKAAGEITIYNSYSSKSQNLIAATRFAAPDGKIFLLNKKAVIPGTTVEGGKIIPSSVKVEVTAENAGKEYNIGPVERFTLPGFSGSPKYNDFYAKSEKSFKGGFVGEAAYPTEKDISEAKEKTVKTLEESLTAFILSQIPKDFKIIDGASRFNVIKEIVNEEVDEKGNFSATVEAESKIIVFKESDLLKLLGESAKQVLGADFEVKNYELKYLSGQPDFENGKLQFVIDYKGIFWRPIDVESFKNSILKKKENELKMAIFSLAGVDKATVSFWPFWVKAVPENIKKIKTEIE